jgi:DNA-binding FadR family transcriptional regulator
MPIKNDESGAMTREKAGLLRPGTAPAGYGGTVRRASPKLAEKVASDIEREILAAGWHVGTIVGSEKELLDRHGVSRAVMREAIRLLEHHMIATMRRGPGGGLIVTAPDAEVVTDSVALLLAYRRATLATIFEARTALELVAAEMTAQRMNESKISELRNLMHREEDPAGYPHVGRHWHIVIAEMTGNPALALFVTSLVRLTDEAVTQSRANRRQPGNPAEVHRAHSRITEAIIAGDAGLARHRTLRHLQGIEAFISDGQPEDAGWPRLTAPL